MIYINVTGVLASLLLLFTSPVDPVLQSKSTQQECSDIAAAAMSRATRIIGDPTYQRVNRALLRELDCRKLPAIKLLICQELAQRASEIGSQGIPGYRNIRELMADMSC